MNKMIKEKVEKKRQEIREESIRSRNEAKEKHICAYCGKPLGKGQRVYCDDDCAYDFLKKYDFSQSSSILRDYKDELKKEYEKEHPKPETDPWSEQKARKEYKCYFCNTTIKAGEKYSKYTRLPEFDDYFDEAPFETFSYHLNCIKFVSVLVDKYLLESEGWQSEEATSIIFAISLKLSKSFSEVIKDITNGNFPPNSILHDIRSEYDSFEPTYWNDSDHSGFSYLYSVHYVAHGRLFKKMHLMFSKPEDPIKAFTEYYKGRNGDKFSHIISFDMVAIPSDEKKSNEKVRE